MESQVSRLHPLVGRGPPLHLRVPPWGQRASGSVGERALSRVVCSPRGSSGRCSCCLRGPSCSPQVRLLDLGRDPQGRKLPLLSRDWSPSLWVLKGLVREDGAQGHPSHPHAVLAVQGLVSAPTFVRAEQVGFFSAQRSPWTMAISRCWWEVNGLDSQGSVFLGLCKPVTPVCKYVAASEPPSHSGKMELSAGLAQGRCGALLGLQEAQTYRPSQRASLLGLPPLVCFVTTGLLSPLHFLPHGL